jgi:hypothetical protein
MAEKKFRRRTPPLASLTSSTSTNADSFNGALLEISYFSALSDVTDLSAGIFRS